MPYAAHGAADTVERRAQRGAPERAAEPARLQPNQDGAVAAVDSDPRPAEGVGAARAACRTAGRIARRGSGANALVGLSVRICDRPAWDAQLRLDQLARHAQLLVERGIVEVGQARVRDRVRTDLPARVREQPELVPAQQPRCAHCPRGDEDRSRHAKLRQDRERMLEHAPVAVVECHRQPMLPGFGSSTARLNVTPT